MDSDTAALISLTPHTETVWQEESRRDSASVAYEREKRKKEESDREKNSFIPA